jgi:hypothetical protein
MWSMQCNVEFGYQLSICSGIEENHGKPWSSWPVAGPLIGGVHLNIIWRSSSYLTGNVLRLRYKDQPVNSVQGDVSVHCERVIRNINTSTSCEDAEMLNAIAVLCLIKGPCRKDGWDSGGYISTHFEPRHNMKMDDRLHALSLYPPIYLA